MRALQAAAIFLALALVGGETIRSLGAGRPLLHVIDDWVAGGLLLFAAWLTGRPGQVARRGVAAIWGAVAAKNLVHLPRQISVQNGQDSSLCVQILVQDPSNQY